MIVTAGARLHSFADAAFALELCGLTISARHVQQLTQEVGTDLARARDAQAEARRHRVLAPRVPTPPVVVAVEVDGGRLRTRASGRGPGVHAAEGKEDKIAGLVTLTDVAAAADPCPEPPPSFVEPRRIQRLVQQMAAHAGETAAAPDEPPADTAVGSTNGTEIPLTHLSIRSLISARGRVRRSYLFGRRLAIRGSNRSGRSATRWTAIAVRICR